MCVCLCVLCVQEPTEFHVHMLKGTVRGTPFWRRRRDARFFNLQQRVCTGTNRPQITENHRVSIPSVIRHYPHINDPFGEVSLARSYTIIGFVHHCHITDSIARLCADIVLSHFPSFNTSIEPRHATSEEEGSAIAIVMFDDA